MLVELLQHDKSSLVRAAAVAGLASTCGSRCSRLLLLTLNDTAKEVCETTPFLLGRVTCCHQARMGRCNSPREWALRVSDVFVISDSPPSINAPRRSLLPS